jgi:cytochrome c oxidase cbb3-type subunit 2
VAQDYVGDAPVLLGSQRIGPDLTNIGARKPNALEFYKHLWDPRSVTPGSMMPPYRFLFEKRRLKPGRPGSPQALPLAPADPSEEIVPTPDADALVAYLLSLHADQPLFEAPVPKPLAAAGGTNTPVTNAPAAATNAAGVTNAPAVVPGP